MAVFILNGLVIILIMSLTSSYVIDDLYPDETETLDDMKSELLELNEMNYMDPNMNIGNNLDMRQVEDIVVQKVAPEIKAAFEAQNYSCWMEALKKVPYRLILEKKKDQQRALRKFFQALQHGKKSTVDALTWLKAKQSEACSACALAKLCKDPVIWNRLALPASLTSKRKVKQCKLKILTLARAFNYTEGERIRCDKNSRFREINGTCNNLDNPRFGSILTPFRRLVPPAYGDGISTLRRALSGDELPNARNVSRFVHGSNAARTNPDSLRLTHLTMSWGQFMDHDFTLAETQSVNCESSNSNIECINIEVPSDDATFRDRGVTFFQLERDAPHMPNTMCKLTPREHRNTLTAYIDASNVYGSTEEEENNLRASNGLLRILEPRHGCPMKSLLPAQLPDQFCVSKDPNRPCFVAGDERVNENQALMSVHTIITREHNRIATYFGEMTPWDGEQIYQETRKIIGAVLQFITYKEFLPLILSPKTIKRNNLELLKGTKFFNGYDPRINAQMSASFSVAAFRFGHSLVQEDFMRFTQDGFQHHCNKAEFSPIPVLDFGNPTYLYDKCNGGVDSIFRGLLKSPAAKMDGRFSSSVQENLFRGEGDLSDLISINIQRGRSRGVASYTTYRNRPECQIRAKVKTFDDLRRAGFDPNDINKLRSQYQSVHDIDLFTGGVLEPVDSDGGVLGPTFQCIIAEQFKRLRVGDRFWHENAPNSALHTDKTAFTSCQLQEIRRVNLAKIICNNAEDIPAVTRKALEQSRIFVSCDKLPDMNLNVFRPGFKCPTQRLMADSSQRDTDWYGVPSTETFDETF